MTHLLLILHFLPLSFFLLLFSGFSCPLANCPSSLSWKCFRVSHPLFLPKCSGLSLLSKSLIDQNACIFNLLQPLCFVRCGEVVKQPRVHFHECFEDVVDESHDGLVPMLLGDAIQSGEHDWHDDLVVFLYQRHDVLVVPEVQRPLGHLKRTSATATLLN